MAEKPSLDRKQLLAETKKHFISSLVSARHTSRPALVGEAETMIAMDESFYGLAQKLAPMVDNEHRELVLRNLKHYGRFYVFGAVLEHGLSPQVMTDHHFKFFSLVKAEIILHQKLLLGIRGSARFKTQSRLLDRQKEEFHRILRREVGKPIKIDLVRRLREEILRHSVQPFCPTQVWRAYGWVVDKFHENLPSLLDEANRRRGE